MGVIMQYMNGFTFRLQQSEKHGFADKETMESLQSLTDSTACDTIILAFGALQDTPQSETIDYVGDFIPNDEELTQVIRYAKEKLGLSVILKPMLNCRNNVWRAHINFFDLEVPCEPKWSKWFESYTDYLLHFAKLAQDTSCDMLIIGCELVQTERKEEYWRSLVGAVREIYTGPLTYNTDKYQEAEVNWWDCLDVISSSGYYPLNKWEENLDRIEEVVKKYKKPFFFAECGCMCRVGCSEVPNDWSFHGETNLQVQADYYQKMFEVCSRRDWIEGFGCWDWVSTYLEYPIDNSEYSVYQKPASKIIRDFYTRNL
jgi:hypothetical protein